MSWRSEKHLKHVRAMPCCVCGAPGPSDPHHFAGRRGMSVKASDAFTVPLCRQHHDEWHKRGRVGVMDRKQTLAIFWQSCAMILAARIQSMEGTLMEAFGSGA